MPVITFLQDIFAAAKGRYFRSVGRHTQKFCSQAAKFAGNDVQKKILLITAISADELVAALIGVDNKRPAGAFGGRTGKHRLTRQQITAALRVYLSGLLTLTSAHKKALLAQAGLEEQELLQLWCRVFDYAAADMQLFDECLLPAYRQEGSLGVSRLVGKRILDCLFQPAGEMSPAETELLHNAMLEDAAAVIRVIQK